MSHICQVGPGQFQAKPYVSGQVYQLTVFTKEEAAITQLKLFHEYLESGTSPLQAAINVRRMHEGIRWCLHEDHATFLVFDKNGKSRVGYLDLPDAVRLGHRTIGLMANGYLRVATTTRPGVDRRDYLHRVVLGLSKPEGDEVVDHVNSNKLDNRRANLRVVTYSENSQNRSLYTDSDSGYRGVSVIQYKGATVYWGRVTLHDRQYDAGKYLTARLAAIAAQWLRFKLIPSCKTIETRLEMTREDKLALRRARKFPGYGLTTSGLLFNVAKRTLKMPLASGFKDVDVIRRNGIIWRYRARVYTYTSGNKRTYNMAGHHNTAEAAAVAAQQLRFKLKPETRNTEQPLYLDPDSNKLHVLSRKKLAKLRDALRADRLDQ